MQFLAGSGRFGARPCAGACRVHQGRPVRSDGRCSTTTCSTARRSSRANASRCSPTACPAPSTGVPPDLVKGYQPPPDQAADNGDAAAAAVAAPAAPAAEAAKPKPKLKPKPKPQGCTRAGVSAANADQYWACPAAGRPRATAGAAFAIDLACSPTGRPATAQPSQSIGRHRRDRSRQQAAQPSQSIWPNPPAPGTSCAMIVLR